VLSRRKGRRLERGERKKERAYVELRRFCSIFNQLLFKSQPEKVRLDKKLELAAVNVPVDLVRLRRAEEGEGS
jgi:hypothetical protein